MAGNTPSIEIGSGDERGQSNTLFVALFFALIFLGTIAGALVGFGVLQNAGDGKTSAAAKAGMLQLRGNMYDIANGAPFRTTTVDVQDGSITYGQPIEIRVSASGGGSSLSTKTIQPQPIIYSLGETKYIFVGGAVFLQQEDGAIIQEGPAFKIDSRQAIIPLINTSHHGGPPRLSIDGDGTVSIIGHKWSTTSTRFEPTQDGDPVEATVTMAVTSPRYQMWVSWFQDHPRFSDVAVDESTNTVSAKFTTKRLYIRQVLTRVKLEA